MNRRDACFILAGAAGLLSVSACTDRAGGAFSQTDGRAQLLVSGAAAMMPLARALTQAFMRERPEVGVIVQAGGSMPAYIAAIRGAIDVAAMTRALSDEEDDAGTRQYLVARADLRIVVHPDTGIADLTRAQVRAAFAGEVRNWRALGGPDRPLNVHAHARGAVARRDAEQLLLDGGEFDVDAREYDNDAALLAALALDPGGIGYLDGHARAGSLGATTLAVGGVLPTRATVLTGRYPYAHSFHLLLHGDTAGDAGDFVRFARGTAGQAIVDGLGLVPAC